MATFVTLIQWTEQGIRTIRDWGQRVSAAEDMVKKAGGQLKETYVTLGEYDVVAIIEAPDDQTAARISLLLASQGNVKTRTMRAFSRNEAETIIAKTFA